MRCACGLLDYLSEGRGRQLRDGIWHTVQGCGCELIWEGTTCRGEDGGWLWVTRGNDDAGEFCWVPQSKLASARYITINLADGSPLVASNPFGPWRPA